MGKPLRRCKRFRVAAPGARRQQAKGGRTRLRENELGRALGRIKKVSIPPFDPRLDGQPPVRAALDRALNPLAQKKPGKSRGRPCQKVRIHTASAADFSISVCDRCVERAADALNVENKRMAIFCQTVDRRRADSFSRILARKVSHNPAAFPRWN
jgi:hypothetical protein